MSCRACLCTMASAGPAELHTSSFLWVFDAHVFKRQAGVPAVLFNSHELKICFSDSPAAIVALKMLVFPFYVVPAYFCIIYVMFYDPVSALPVFQDDVLVVELHWRRFTFSALLCRTFFGVAKCNSLFILPPYPFFNFLAWLCFFACV